jgi:hypothetical protein
MPIAQTEGALTSIVQSAGFGRAELVDPNQSVGPGSGGEYAPAASEPVTGVRLHPFATRGGKNAGQVALIVVVVLTAIGLVLVLACANVTNLLLASAIARRTEIGLRIALGARRGRIVRQLLTESLSLGLIAGALGLLFTVWLLPILAGVVGVPDTFDVRPDGRAYAFLCFISILAGLGAGLAPSKGRAAGCTLADEQQVERPFDRIETTARRSGRRTGGRFDGAARAGGPAGPRRCARGTPRHRFRRIGSDDHQRRVPTRNIRWPTRTGVLGFCARAGAGASRCAVVGTRRGPTVFGQQQGHGFQASPIHDQSQ